MIAALLTAFAAFFFFVAPRLAADRLNPVINKPPYQISEKARDLHSRLFVADMHADSLLWSRDLNKRDFIGHVDIPRLLEGNVALQAFTVVTKSPRGLNIEKNSGASDNVTLLALSEMQPLENLSSLTKRAVWQAGKLRRFADESGGKLMIVKSKGDLARLLETRKTAPVVGGWLGIEGAHALDDRVENVQVLFDAGFRMMSPTHFFDTKMGGSAHGVEKYGLTESGRAMVREMERLGMLVDLAHASEQTINDVLVMAAKPVVVSHTGARGTCDNNRNLTDDQLRRIAKNGGLIGIGFWDTATCGHNARSIARAIKHAANIAGIDHVALGSDFDGSVETPFDAGGMALITDALLQEGFNEQEIEKVMGGNIFRLLQANLPD